MYRSRRRDFDNDGALDLYVVRNGPNALYRNGGDGDFTEMAGPAGVADPGHGSGLWPAPTTCG